LSRLSQVGFGLFGLSFIPATCLFDVDGGERVVMFNMFSGIEEKVRGEGTHFKIPWVHQPKSYTIRLRPKLIQSSTGTKDLQMVTVHCRMLYKPNVEGLPKIHQTLGEDYDERVLPSIANEVLKATIAQYNAEQLLTHREHVSREIREAIVTRAAQFDILMDDVSITHLTYGKEFPARLRRSRSPSSRQSNRSSSCCAQSRSDKQQSLTPRVRLRPPR